MKTLLCINKHESFWGTQYFDNPELFEREGIEPSRAVIDEYEPENFEEVVEEYPEEDVDVILLHKLKALSELCKTDVYNKTPICLAAHVVFSMSGRIKRYRDAIDSGREIIIFAGSVRAARSYYVPDKENLKVVIAPIMGRSTTPYGKLPEELISDPEKEYDIGFFSALTYMKRPHQVLETANNIAEKIGRELDVWISGHHHYPPEYHEVIKKIVADGHFEHINVAYEGFMSSEELYERVQKTRVMYMPLAKNSETTCYSAWEIVSLDVPIIGSDWAGVGEAIQHSRHPQSKAVPVEKIEPEGIFSESVKKSYPDKTEKTIETIRGPVFTVHEDRAEKALIEAIETEVPHDRELHVPERVHAKSTIAAFSDIMSGMIQTDQDIFPKLVKSKHLDEIKSIRGYSILREPTRYNPLIYQDSTYIPVED